MDAKIIIDQVADIQRSGKKTLCPRCGRDSMNEKLVRNALSRYARVYICDDCYPSNTVIRGNMVKLP